MTLSVAVAHKFPGFDVDVTFTAPPGVTALFGRSGAGKTTIVQAVAGLLRPDHGRVAVGEWELFDISKRRWLPPHRRQIGYVFQEGRLFPHLNVRQNLLYGRFFSAEQNSPEFEQVTGMLGLGALLTRRPGRLSGGEKQRVALGRALLSAPRLLLMDEPLAALDAYRKADILPYLERLRDSTDIPILYVSHSVTEIARLATTVIAVEGGRVRHAGPAAQILSDPEAVPALGVRDAGSILSGRIASHHHDGLTEVSLAAGPIFLPRVTAEPGTPVRVRIAAKDVILSRERPHGLSALNILPAEVADLRADSGPGMLLRLKLAEENLLAQITKRSAASLGLAQGVRCHVIIKTVSVAPVDIGSGHDAG